MPKRKTMKKTDIEILMATCNGAAYLRKQLDSILNQSCTSWHLTVSDDGSADETPRILEEYALLYPEKISLVNLGQRFGSAKAHFMSLIARCDADIIALCDQDDVWFSDKLEKMAALLRKNMRACGEKTPLLVFSDQIPTDARLKPISDSLVRMQALRVGDADWRSFVFQNVVTGGACMFDGALAKLACANYDAEKIIMHDWWLGLTAARFGRIAYLNEPTGYYRQHEKNSVGAKNVLSLSYVIDRLMHPASVYEGILLRKTQAIEMQNAYGGSLTEADREFLRRFGKRRSGLTFYLRNMPRIHGFFKRAALILMG